MTLTAVINPVVPLNLLFPHQRVILTHSRQSAKYRIFTHNFTNDDLTDDNYPSYQYCQILALWNTMKTLFVRVMYVGRAQYNVRHYGKHEILLLDTSFYIFICLLTG